LLLKEEGWYKSLIFNFFSQIMPEEIVIRKEKCVIGRGDRRNNCRCIETADGKGREDFRSHLSGHGA
jgi:hypothetical protein